MKTDLLFPNKVRPLGWTLFVCSAILGMMVLHAGYITPILSFWNFDGTSTTYLDELATIGVVIGLLLIGFSREKVEDEMIQKLRLESLQWSVYINYLLLMIATLFVYDAAFFMVMIYNMFTILLVFIVRFRWFLHQNEKGKEVLV